MAAKKKGGKNYTYFPHRILQKVESPHSVLRELTENFKWLKNNRHRSRPLDCQIKTPTFFDKPQSFGPHNVQQKAQLYY